MRISKVAKKSMAVAMAMAVAVGSVAVAPTKDASAAKAKSKKVNARVFFAGNAKGADCIWIAGDGKSAKAVSKNVTLKKGKKTKVTLSSKKLKNKKKLYVRVKAVGAKKWSKVVKIKVKK
mgnify:FL=1